MRQDLAKTVTLLQKVEDDVPHYTAGSNLNFLVETLSEFEPQLLQQLAELVVAPKDKNAIVLAQLETLLREDPSSARSLVERTPSGWLKEDLAMTYAGRLLETDLDAAIAYAGDFFHRETPAWQRGPMIADGDYPRMVQPKETLASQLLTDLLNRAPEQLLDTLANPVEIGVSDEMEFSKSYHRAALQWARQDSDRPGSEPPPRRSRPLA